MSDSSVVVVGGGITGLATAHRLLKSGRPGLDVTVLESSARIGGKIRTGSFAGIDGVEEGPDAYLARVPHAVALTRELGLEVTNPATGHASVFRRGLHPIPDGLVLGVPSDVGALARSPLFTRRGKWRAALEPFVPSTSDHDSIGHWVRHRLGDEVHEYLVDPLVGSIYAADTDRFSLAMVPQLAELARHRRVSTAARRIRRTAPNSSSPVFETPRHGLGTVVESLAAEIARLGGRIVTDSAAIDIGRDSTSGIRWAVETSTGIHRADAVVVTSPARHSASLFTTISPDVALGLAMADHASVAIVLAAVDSRSAEAWRGSSGYLVPKPEQRHVTAVSFASNKWAHWRPPDGSHVLRISIGRDGNDDSVREWDDDRIVATALDEFAHHTGTSARPTTTRVVRWIESFPQYRPGHLARLEAIERRLADDAPGIRLAGASHRGIGLPACVAQAHDAARHVTDFLDGRN